MTVSTTPLSRIGQIAMPVKDIDRAVAFYRDRLGLPFLFAAPPRLAFFDCGGTRLMLDVPEDAASRIRARCCTSWWTTSTRPTARCRRAA